MRANEIPFTAVITNNVPTNYLWGCTKTNDRNDMSFVYFYTVKSSFANDSDGKRMTAMENE